MMHYTHPGKRQIVLTLGTCMDWSKVPDPELKVAGLSHNSGQAIEQTGESGRGMCMCGVWGGALLELS